MVHGPQFEKRCFRELLPINRVEFFCENYAYINAVNIETRHIKFRNFFADFPQMWHSGCSQKKICRVNQILYRIVPQQLCLPAYEWPEFFIISRLYSSVAQSLWLSYTHLQFRRSLFWLESLSFLLALVGGSYKEEQKTSETNILSHVLKWNNVR